MDPQTTKYFIITVHYGDPAVTHRLIKSLQAVRPAPHHLFVIDHGVEAFNPNPPTPNLQVIRPQHNHGYGAGLVLGLGAAVAHTSNPKETPVFCMNNDLQIQDGAVADALGWWLSQPQPILAALRSAHLNLLTGRAHLGTLRGTHYPSLPYLHGSLLLGSLDTLVRLRIPTDYFLYSEDVAVSQHARRQKVVLATLPNAQVFYHPEAKSQDPLKTYYLVRNGARVLEEEAPAFWRLWWQGINHIRRFYHNHRASGRPIARAVAQALVDAKAGRVGQTSLDK